MNNLPTIQDQISGQRQYDFVAKFNYIREAGTDAEHRAADTICQELAAMGLQGRLEPFTFPVPVIQTASFTVTAPYQKEYAATGCGFCENTPEEGIEADFLYVENADAISLREAQGKIIMLNGPVRGPQYQRLRSSGALGFLCVGGTPLDAGEKRIPAPVCLPNRPETPCMPGASIHYLDAVELIAQGASRARLTVLQSHDVHTSGNVAVRIEGRDKKDEILTVTAHYDSVPAGPGAYDNMAGCAIVMELCRYFQANPPRRTMEFIWFGGEEKGMLGSAAYVKAHEDELSRHRFNMNIDLAGQAIGGNVIGATTPASACALLEELGAKSGIGMSVRHNVWSSDSNTFAWKRIPAITLNRDGFGMHTEHDTIDLISPWSLKRSAVLLGTIAEALSESEEFPIGRDIPEEFLKKLDLQFERFE